jgi:hypothetical protein
LQKIWQKYWRFFAQTAATFSKNLIVSLVFEKNSNFFRQKLAKISENSDHYIDPWSNLEVVEERDAIRFPESLLFLAEEEVVGDADVEEVGPVLALPTGSI